MNGIAFGQSSHVRYIKTKRSFDICYTIEENTHKRGEVQLQIEDIKAELSRRRRENILFVFPLGTDYTDFTVF